MKVKFVIYKDTGPIAAYDIDHVPSIGERVQIVLNNEVRTLWVSMVVLQVEENVVMVHLSSNR